MPKTFTIETNGYIDAQGCAVPRGHIGRVYLGRTIYQNPNDKNCYWVETYPETHLKYGYTLYGAKKLIRAICLGN